MMILFLSSLKSLLIIITLWKIRAATASEERADPVGTPPQLRRHFGLREGSNRNVPWAPMFLYFLNVPFPSLLPQPGVGGRTSSS